VPALTYGLGLALPLAVLQGGIDLFLWGRPFAELTEYVLYNMANTTTYFDQPWYNYLLLLLGIFIPPSASRVLRLLPPPHPLAALAARWSLPSHTLLFPEQAGTLPLPHRALVLRAGIRIMGNLAQCQRVVG
jgi:hypothetical protein